MVTAGEGGKRTWLNRVVDLYPTARPPAPAMETAGDPGVLADRLLAALADVLVCLVLLELPALYLLDLLSGGALVSAPGAPLLSLAALAPLYVTYSFAFEWRYSRTPGKVWRDLTTVLADGTPCTLRASAVRNLLRYVDGLGVPPLVLGAVLARASPRGRRLGDRLAGTVVVRPR